MRISLSSIFGLGLIFLSGQVSAYVYSIENGLTTQTIDPLSKAESAATYYDYGSLPASGTPDFGTVSDTGFFWLYEDTTTNILSLGMIFDTPNDGDGGSVSMTSSGMPGTSFVSVQDDASDGLSDLINNTESWRWISCCTDGAMVSGLEDSAWTISLDLLSSTGIDSWFFLDGPDALNPVQIALDMGETLLIKSESVGVPEPSILALLGLGLAGLGFSRTHRKKT